ncbi:MAG TPA: T9SS type A sorting domain-containing protein [Candidatus Kapabacteria bacterium]|nr:T9SS type A sorting domain-containing protein [Candidatus Kapabacteria bacterium]
MFCILGLVYHNLFSQSVKDMSINIKTYSDIANRKITLTWDSDTNTYNYFIYKKNTKDSLFGNYIARLAKEQNFWTDTLLDNIETEYKIEKDAGRYSAFAYIISGTNIPEKDYYGTCLVLVDEKIYPEIATELETFVSEVRADGWQVIVKKAPRSEEFDKDKVEATKKIILNTKSEDKNLASLVLIGRIAVPYSGNFAVDGHEDHYGAWPSDLYYADLDGKWTDTLTSKYKVIPRTMNLPNDGKFDQNYINSDVELQMGRIDLYNMPYFKDSEVELIKRYLAKISDFKNGKVHIRNRGGVIDNFGPDYTEGFAATGWANFASLLGSDSVFKLKDRYVLQTQDYLWYYGCGPGSYASAHEALYTSEMASVPHLAAFNLIFGSYHGDWDSENSLLRSVLGALPYGYASCWAGRPHWFFHNMAYGYTLGYCTKLTQNVYPSNYTAVSSFARRMNHIALLGDPTLRMSYFERPSNVITQVFDDSINVKWDYQNNEEVHFNIYRTNDINTKFIKINTSPIIGNSFTDKMPLLGANIYEVRAIRNEKTQAGSYYNISLGRFSDISTFPIEYGKKLIIAPNPFIDDITIIPIDKDTVKSIIIYDINGLKLGEHNNINLSKNYSFKISDITNISLSAGAYFIKIKTTSEEKVYKLIKL